MEYLYVIIIILFLDFIYLLSAKETIFKMVKKIQQEDVNIKIAPLFLIYALMSFGLYYFIIKPRKKVEDAFVLGILVNGVYELTNYAIFKKWDLVMMLLDGLWGGILFALTAHLTYKVIGVRNYNI
jgi:uncharacterized membrane protein